MLVLTLAQVALGDSSERRRQSQPQACGHAAGGPACPPPHSPPATGRQARGLGSELASIRQNSWRA